MSYDADRQVFNAAQGLGCFAFVALLVLVPPLFLPGALIFLLAKALGLTSLHPALIIVFGIGMIWLCLKAGGAAIRAMPVNVARTILALYIGACYAALLLDAMGGTKRMDVLWLAFGFAVFTLIGWKVAGIVVARAHRSKHEQMLRDRS